MNQDFWVGWFGIHAGREVGSPKRFWIENPKEFVKFVERCNRGERPCYMSVQPYRGRNQVFGLEKLYFDFDSKKNPPDLDKAWSEAHDFAVKLHKYYDIGALTVFSGCKGYNVYAWLWRVAEFRPQREGFAKRVYVRLQEKLLAGLSYETLDPEVIGDIKRLARVPYTVHPETGRLCQPLTMKREPLMVLPTALQAFRRNGIQKTLFQKVVVEVNEEERTQKKLAKFEKRKSSASYIGVRPCFPEVLKNPDLPHKLKVAVVTEYYHAGVNKKDIEALFLNQTDYRADQTAYQVNHIIEHGYKPFRCSTIQTLGYCLQEACPIFKRRKGGEA